MLRRPKEPTPMVAIVVPLLSDDRVIENLERSEDLLGLGLRLASGIGLRDGPAATVRKHRADCIWRK